MLKGWFNGLNRSSKKLRSDSVDVRREYLSNLSRESAADLQDELWRAFEHEEDGRARGLILNLLGDLTPLTAHLDGHGGQQVADHLAANHDRATSEQLDHPRVIRARLAATDDSAIRQSILADIRSRDLLLELAVTLKGEAQDQLLELPQLTSADALTALEHASRGRDKRVNRHARDRLNAIRQAREAAEAARERIEGLRTTIQRVIAEDPQTPAARESRRAHLLALKSEFTSAQEALDGETGPDPFSGIDLTPPKESPFGAVLETLPAADEPTTLDSLQQALDSAEAQWLALSAMETPSAELSREYTIRTEPLHGLLAAHKRLSDAGFKPAPDPSDISAARQWCKRQAKSLSRIRWPDSVPEPDSLIREKTKLAEIESAMETADQAAKEKQNAVSKMLEQAAKAIDAGESNKGRDILQSARSAIGELPEQAGRPLEKRLGALFAQLGELRDWQSFATSPKREALVTSMQSLVGSDKPPEALAEEIKALRKEWNDLGRPTNKHEYELKEAFDKAADEAFEPCRTHFAALGEARQANLDARQQLVNQLSAYLDAVDWSSVDANAAEQIMRTARQEWRNAFPIPRGKGKALTREFESLQQSLRDGLQKVWDRHVAAKQAIIEQAAALKEMEDAREQLDAVKALQARWKTVGPIPRSQDQKLWQEFRMICDAIFDARKEASNARQAEWDARRADAEAVNKALEASLTEPAERRTLSDFKAQFEALGNLGREGAGIVKRHQELCDAYNERLKAADQAAREASIEALRAEDEAQADAGSQTSDETLAALRELAIVAEIVSDNASPAEDASRRMEIQVELMNQGGGNAQLPSSDELLKRWRALPDKGTEADVKALRQRFFAAIS